MQNNSKLAAIVVALLVACVLGALPFFAVKTVTTSSCAMVKDQDFADINYSNSFQVGCRTNEYYVFYSVIYDPIVRGFITFTDLFEELPPGAVINSAKLRLHASSIRAGECSDTANRVYDLYRVTGYWSKNAVTWNNQPSYSSSKTHSLTRSPKMNVNVWWEFDVTNDVLGFYAGTHPNYGWVLREQTEWWNVAPGAVVRYIVYFDTSGTYAPQLVIDYTVPTYTLTVNVADQYGTPLTAEITVLKDYTIVASGTTTDGTWSKTLDYGTYTVQAEWMGETKTESVPLTANRWVTLTFSRPSYTLTIKTEDTVGTNLVADVEVFENAISIETGKTSALGIYSTSLPLGSYTVKARYEGVTKETSVTLDKSKTYTFTFPAVAKTYDLTITVKDQVGHHLRATVTVGTKMLTCDEQGRVLTTVETAPGETSVTVTITAEIAVGEKQFSATKTITLTADTSETMIITRRFLWEFYMNYTNGILANGTLYTSGKESLTIPIEDGRGTAYLLDGTYTLSFEPASPKIDIGSITVENDGELYATLKTEIVNGEEVTTTEETSTVGVPYVPTPIEIPWWILIPSVYIYGLLAVLVFGFIVAAYVRLRRPYNK